jgi:glycine cleavage system H lipoate-binding protein
MKPLQARYNVFTNDAGGAHDDVIFYRLPERWLLIVNAGNATRCGRTCKRSAAGDVELTDLRGERALIAIQGPRSVEVLAPLVEADIAALKYYTCAETRRRGARAVVARTGYTGEDGFELFLPAEARPVCGMRCWPKTAPRGLAPCGLGARDVLRLEAGMPLYGHELTEEITPLQAGLGWAVKFASRRSPARRRSRRKRRRRRLSAHRGPGAGRPRARARRLSRVAQRRRAGEIRSGSIAPSSARASRPRCSSRRAQPSERGWESRFYAGTEHPGDDGRITVLQARLGTSGTTGGAALQQRTRVGEARRRRRDDRDHRLRAGSLGDIVYVELPRVGATLAQFASIGVVESVKAVSDIFTPLGGEVLEINARSTATRRSSTAIRTASGWFYKLKLADVGEDRRADVGRRSTTS